MKKFLIILALLPILTLATTLTLSYYECSKCRTLIQSNAFPSAFNCPSGSTHNWCNLGEVGDRNYQCRKCGILVKTKNYPNSFNCPMGSMHYWYSL